MALSSARNLARFVLPLAGGGGLRASSTLWGLYMASLTSYCMIHQWIVSATTPDLPGSVLWILQEWGIWLVITPLVFSALRRRASPSAAGPFVWLQLAGLSLLAALAARCLVDQLTEAQGIGPVLVIYTPRYLAAAAVVLLVGHWLTGTRSSARAPAIREPAADRHDTALADTLLVSKGNDECLLPVADIHWVSAAGNYVEIHSQGQAYLLRSTMKQLEERLPAGRFLRIHRSHLVRLDMIERIKNQASGKGLVYLHNGQALPMSRHCRLRLQRSLAKSRA